MGNPLPQAPAAAAAETLQLMNDLTKKEIASRNNHQPFLPPTVSAAANLFSFRLCPRRFISICPFNPLEWWSPPRPLYFANVNSFLSSGMAPPASSAPLLSRPLTEEALARRRVEILLLLLPSSTVIDEEPIVELSSSSNTKSSSTSSKSMSTADSSPSSSSSN